MLTVLYTNDFEPITVLSLQRSAVRMLEDHGRISLAVLTPPSPQANGPPVGRPAWDEMCSVRYVSIFAEKLCRRGKTTMMLFTDDEEAALLLKAAFLPGQTRAVNDREMAGFGRGFLAALDLLGSGE